MWVPKLLLPPIKIKIFGPKTAIFAPKYAFWAHMLVGCWLVVVARGLYLTRHLLLYSVIGQVWRFGSYIALLHLQPAPQVQPNVRPFSWQNAILACGKIVHTFIFIGVV